MDGHPDCLLIQSQLQLHAGGDLTREEGELVERHLERCPTCAATAAGARASRERLAAAAVGADVLAPSASLWTRIAPQLEEEGWIRGPRVEPGTTPVIERAPVRGRVLPVRRLLFASGLAAAVMCGGWWLSTRGGDEVPSRTDDPIAHNEGSGAPSSEPTPIESTPEVELVAETPTGLRRMNAGERPFSDFAQDPAALRVLPVTFGSAPASGATPASARELR